MATQAGTGALKAPVTVKTVVTAALTVVGLGLLLYVLWRAGFAFSMTVVAAILAVSLDRAVNRLQRRGIGRRQAIALAMAAVLAVVVGIFLVIIPPAVSQGQELVRALPSIVESVRRSSTYERLNRRFDLDRVIAEAQKNAPARLETAIGPGIKAVSSVVHGVTGLLAVFFLLAFMLLYAGGLVQGLLDEALPDRRERYARVLSRIARSVGGYLSGLAAICLVNAVVTTIYLAIVRLPFFLPLGILSGLSSLVPLVGNTIVGAVITFIALLVGGPWKALATAIFFILYQQFENHVLGPQIYRRTVRLNPLVVALALFFFADLGGIGAAVVAVPAAAAGQIVLHEVLRYRRERLGLPSFGPVAGGDRSAPGSLTSRAGRGRPARPR